MAKTKTKPPPTDERRFIGLQTPAPTPNNPHFNYIPSSAYNNPFREYKAPLAETNYRPPNPKFFKAALHGSTAQKEGVIYPENASRYAPEADLLYKNSGNAFDEYVRQRNQSYGNGLVSELDGFMAKQQPGREKQYLLDMIDRQRLRTTNPMVGKEALGLYPEELMLRDPLEERPWHQGRGGAPGHMPPPRISPPDKSDYTLEEQQADLENMGYMALVDAPHLRKDFRNPPFYVTYRDQDRVGAPTPNSSVKAKYVHEASHLRGFANQKQRDKQIANYFKIITNDPLNRILMSDRYKKGMDFGGPDYDYIASPEEMLSRIDQTRQYMKDVYGSDEFHKLSAKDAVRIWIESNSYVEGLPTNGDNSLGYGPLYDPEYTASSNLTPEQIRLLLQNNLWR